MIGSEKAYEQSNWIANHFLFLQVMVLVVAVAVDSYKVRPLSDHHPLFPKIPPHNPLCPPALAQVIDNLQLIVPAELSEG